MKRRLITAAALLLTAGCSGPETPGGPPGASSLPPAASSGPAAPPVPGFTEVHEGDTESVVRLRRYHPRARAVVVEPTIFLMAPDFCAAFRLPDTDERCERPWATEDSKVKVTLPVSTEVELRTVGDGYARCVDEETGDGTCKWSSAGLAERVGEEGGFLARLTTRDGTVTRIAELYVS